MNNYCISGGLSVDWLSNKLYILGYSHNHLEVIDLNNGYRKELNSTTSYNSIAVDPTNRYNAMRVTIVYHMLSNLMPLLIILHHEQVLNNNIYT